MGAKTREDFREHTAMETVISFLQVYGCPRQMTFDRDPRWVGSSSGRDFPSPRRSSAVMPRHPASGVPPAATGQECLRGKISPDLWAGMFTGASSRDAPRGAGGDRGLPAALQLGTPPSRTGVRQRAASRGLPHLADLAGFTCAGGPRWLACRAGSPNVAAPCGS